MELRESGKEWEAKIIITLLLLLPFTESLLCFREYINTISCSPYKKRSSQMWSHTAGRWQSWYLNPGLSDAKIHKHASSGVMVPLQRVHHIALVPGVNLKIRQRIPSYFFSVFLWTESAGVRHLSLSQLRTWASEAGRTWVNPPLPLWLITWACGWIALHCVVMHSDSGGVMWSQPSALCLKRLTHVYGIVLTWMLGSTQLHQTHTNNLKMWILDDIFFSFPCL